MPDDSVLKQSFCDALNELKSGWEVVERGIIGPEGALVRFAERHESEAKGHVDVQFVLFEEFEDQGHLWDCVSGFGDTPVKRAKTAAHLWASTTGGALLELKYSRRGEFADHYAGGDAGGFSGWHVISGAILGFGSADSASQLQAWWLNHPVLPAIAEALEESLLDGDCPHGIKILFGGDGIAEVRVNGDRHEGASDVLACLEWPRLIEAASVRSYVVVLHRDG